MKSSRIYTHCLIGCLLFLGITFMGGVFSAVHAAATIQNLDDKPHTIVVDDKEVVIEPNHSWGAQQGAAKVMFQGREVRLDNTDNFAIWNDHDFGPQRRGSPGAGLSHR